MFECSLVGQLRDHALTSLMRERSLRSFNKAFLQIFFTEGRGVRLCWQYQKPKNLTDTVPLGVRS